MNTRNTRRCPRTVISCLIHVMALVMVPAMVLAGCGAAQSKPTAPAVTPTATTDAATQAYLSLLRQYYVPLANAHGDMIMCYSRVAHAAPAKQSDLMANCKPLVAAELTAAHTLQGQLVGATPPAQWNTQATALTKATQDLITILAGLATAIDAQDIAGFLKLENPGFLAAGAVCPPINKINAGPPALEPPLPLLDPNSCNGIY